MMDTVLNILMIMGWLGIVLGILSIVNIVTQTLVNVWSNKENFIWKKMIKGIIKVLVFFISSAFVAIAFTILPFINLMITNSFGTELISNELLNTFSNVGVLAIVISTITIQARKALDGVLKLANISSNIEENKNS